jgi:hypothetical protein
MHLKSRTDESRIELFQDAVMDILEHANAKANRNALAGSPHGLSIIAHVLDGTLWLLTTNIVRERHEEMFQMLSEFRTIRRKAINTSLPKVPVVGPVPSIPSNARIEALIYGGIPVGIAGPFEEAACGLITELQTNAGSGTHVLTDILQTFNARWVPLGLHAHAMIDREKELAVFLSDEPEEEQRLKDFDWIWHAGEQHDMTLDPSIKTLAGEFLLQNHDRSIPLEVKSIHAMVNGVDDATPLSAKPGWFSSDLVRRLDALIIGLLTR